MSLFWTGDFTGSGKTETLFWFPGDKNYWLGQFNGNQLTYTLAGNTAGFGGSESVGKIWVGEFTGSGHSQLLFYFPGDGNWWLGSFSGTQLAWTLVGNTRSIHVRRSISALSPTGPEIASLRRGFQVMMSRQPTDPTSYRFQANIHGTYDSAMTQLETQAWTQFQHGSFFFLSWHRMYLYYLERILRAASGDPNLALPYWNYTDPAQRTLPIAFREPSNPSTNPLFIPVPGRPANVDDGTFSLPDSAVVYDCPTGCGFADVNFPSPAGSGLSFGGQETSPTQPPDNQNFPHGAFEKQPHDAVHGALGGFTGLMGDPDRAANDPIFWLHHANIDRLWKRWLDQDAGRQDPVTDSLWMNTVFQFFDENGQPVQKAGREILNTVAQLNYRYDDDPIATAGLVQAQLPVGQPVES